MYKKWIVLIVTVAVIFAAGAILIAYFNAIKIEKLERENLTLSTELAKAQQTILELRERTYRWVRAERESCLTACSREGSKPIISGQYPNQNPFYICRTNANFEGFRAVYNLEPVWSHSCYVGWGGQEKPYDSYECMCQ